MVLDSSVVIKWFRQEEVLASEALALRQAYLEGRTPVTVPTLLLWEVSNALRFKHELSAAEVREAMSTLWDMDLEWIAPDPTLLSRTVDLAFGYGTTIYDAAFAALAELRETLFVTADDRLVRKLEAFPHVRYLGEPGLAGGGGRS